MGGWIGNIEELARGNAHFRDTPFTGEYLQMTVMCLQPGESIGRELHAGTDQFLRVEQGRGHVELGATEQQVDERHLLTDDDAIIIPAGTWHDLVNDGPGELKLYSIYAPPQHAPRTLHHTKAEAQAAETHA